MFFSDCYLYYFLSGSGIRCLLNYRISAIYGFIVWIGKPLCLHFLLAYMEFDTFNNGKDWSFYYNWTNRKMIIRDICVMFVLSVYMQLITMLIFLHNPGWDNIINHQIWLNRYPKMQYQNIKLYFVWYSK